MLKEAGIQRQVGTRSSGVVWFVGGLLPMADWYGVPCRETRGVKVPNGLVDVAGNRHPLKIPLTPASDACNVLVSAAKEAQSAAD